MPHSSPASFLSLLQLAISSATLEPSPCPKHTHFFLLNTLLVLFPLPAMLFLPSACRGPAQVLFPKGTFPSSTRNAPAQPNSKADRGLPPISPALGRHFLIIKHTGVYSYSCWGVASLPSQVCFLWAGMCVIYLPPLTTRHRTQNTVK